MSFLRVTCDAIRGLQCPKETCEIWTWRKLIVDTFNQTTMTHVINFFASFPVVKQEHVEGNTGCIGFPHLFIGFPSVMVPSVMVPSVMVPSVMVVIANFSTQ